MNNNNLIFYIVAFVTLVINTLLCTLAVISIYLREVLQIKSNSKIKNSKTSIETELAITSILDENKNEPGPTSSLK